MIINPTTNSAKGKLIRAGRQIQNARKLIASLPNYILEMPEGADKIRDITRRLWQIADDIDALKSIHLHAPKRE